MGTRNSNCHQLDDIEAAIRGQGLEPRGAFHVVPDDGVPDTARGPARTVVLAGNIGGSLWPAFAASAEFAHVSDPLDTWARRIGTAIADDVGADAIFPFDGPPHHPFQRWAQRAEPVHPSPIGLLIHPDWGLWHAYRVALAFAATIALPPLPSRPSPCAMCAAKPCLTTCPVGAFDGARYDVAACVAHVTGLSGGACRDGGCLARRACPIGQAKAYVEAQQRFHMEAFLTSRRSKHQG